MIPTTDAERSDTERLDWMISQQAVVTTGGFDAHWLHWVNEDRVQDGDYPTARQAIDAAMSLTQETPRFNGTNFAVSIHPTDPALTYLDVDQPK